MKTDFTYLKFSIVGVFGGLVLIAMLSAVLYNWLPSNYLSGWLEQQPDSAPFVMNWRLLAVLAVLVTLVTGFVAAWWANAGRRGPNLLRGALAGGIAGGVLFYGVAGSAAAVVGNAVMLEHGATYDPDMLVPLLVTAITDAIQWNYLVFWLCLLVGAGLGALGGVLAPLRQDQPANPYHGWMIWLGIALGGVLGLVIQLTIYNLLETQAVRAVAEADQASFGASGPPSLAGISLWPMVTGEILFFAPLIGFLWLLWRDLASAEPQRLAAAPRRAASGATLALLVSMMQLNQGLPWRENFSARWLLLACGLLGLLAAGAFFYLVWRAETQARAAEIDLPADRYFGLLSTLAGVLLAFVTLLFPPISGLVVPAFLVGLVGTAIGLRMWARLPLGVKTPSEERQHEYRSSIFSTILGMLLVSLVLVPVSLGMVLIPINMISVLNTADAAPVDLASEVQTLYTINYSYLAFMLVGTVAAAGITWAVMALMKVRTK